MVSTVLPPVAKSIIGKLQVPGDKSISHRSVIMGSLAVGTTHVTNFLNADDCLQTVEIFRQLGVSIEQKETTLQINSQGPSSFKEPAEPLYMGNSGTTARLMVGVLSGLSLFSIIYGDKSLAYRPMNRVVQPLKDMGAHILGRSHDLYMPLAIKGGSLSSIQYIPPVKSAQVKSAVLLGGLLASGVTKIRENVPTRNHTENMLQAFGADLSYDQGNIHLTNKQNLMGTSVHVPSDISSAAFFMAAAAITPGSHLTLLNVGLNYTRTGIIDVLINMGADINITDQQTTAGETFGNITIKYRSLSGTIIQGDLIPRLIDELPAIALVASQAEGRTIIRDAEELRVKETDRIRAITEGLANLGANIKSTNDGMIIEGVSSLTGGEASAYNDHRIAMMLSIASFAAESNIIIDDISSINISYPDFFRDLEKITSNR